MPTALAGHSAFSNVRAGLGAADDVVKADAIVITLDVPKTHKRWVAGGERDVCIEQERGKGVSRPFNIVPAQQAGCLTPIRLLD